MATKIKSVGAESEVAEVTEPEVAEVTSITEPKVKITLPLLSGKDAQQDVFVAVNFKTYRIQRGVEVEVPESVYEVLKESQRAADEEIREKIRRAFKEA